ncbi:uncharacterized protein LOC110175793 isoform X2 [Boleophthalmus pectinirostris]|uniref:uncharacterized protein LOC110175793 isoform X2 n=1 Tax=Boleophthalmus pectinirostris TaxID=150288 RepID=UPI002430CA15|nr:uncharacterized protein LOC110175793 isoform X2 [Boleophthalmus pectinirostris]
MDLKSVFFLLCFSLLQSRGDSVEVIKIYQYNRTGEDVTLLCDRVKHYGPNCSTVKWSHYKIYTDTDLVWNGQIQNSSRSTRLTLNPDCSLSIKNITEGDYGEYFCRTLNNQYKYESVTYIYLSVLSVSVAQPNLDQTPTGHITLQCKLWKYLSLPSCSQNSFLWLDINGVVLSGDGVTQKNCESNLTVELQCPQIRTFTCQYQENDRVQVSEEYSLWGDTDPSLSLYIISAAVGGGLVLLAVALGLFFKIKSKKKTTQSIEETEGASPAADATNDPENGMTYAMIEHHTPRAKIQVKEIDDVTYSEVKRQNTAKSEQSDIYSQVKKKPQD